TLSVLGKFDGKSDEGFLVGYSLNSKAYRVYNLVTKRVEVNLHVNFLEDKPNVKGVGYRWMFDIDYLTDSMNYIPEKDESRTSSTNSKQEETLPEPQKEKKDSSTDSLEDNSKIQAFRRELEEIALKHLGTVPENNTTSTPSINTGSQTVNTELEIFHKSETGIFDEASYDEEGVITDFNSLPTEIEVSPTPTLRIHNIHPKSQILGDPKSAVQTRSKVQTKSGAHAFLSHIQKQQRNNHKDQQHSPFDLEAFSDSDYGGSNLDRKSTTGGCQFLGQRLISWQCKKQTIVATSTTEAEYVAAANCCGQTCYEKKLISVEKIHTDLNVADLLTKPFDGPRFNYLVVSIADEKCRFAEIVDFLRGQPQTATTKTIANGTLEIHATIDTKGYTITEASIRDTLQLADATEITMLPNDEIFEGMGQMGYPTDGTFTFWKSFFTPQWRYLVHHLLHCISSKSGGWDQFGSNIATALICLSTDRVYNFSKLIFDGMVANLKSKTKFLMYPRFLQLILNIQTENKHLYLAVTLTKKIFGNMKRGFRGAPRPLLPAMLLVATTNPNAGQEHHPVTQTQPSSSTLPVPSTSSPPVQSPPPIPASIPTPTPIPETEPEPFEHTFEEPSPVHQHFSPPQEQAQGQMTMDDLLQLVKKVKKLEGILKRRNVVLSDSKEEEPEAQGRKSQDDPLDSLVQGLVTPSMTKVNASGEEQVEDIRDIWKKEKKTKWKEVSQLIFQEEVDAGAKEVNTAEGVNTGSIKLSTVSEQYPLSAEVCKAMLDKKLQGGKPDENCYKMLKMMEKQAGIRK
ncbi:uncharacterized mitochondrial protein-like protein, partial [Tanacetum coccineum]